MQIFSILRFDVNFWNTGPGSPLVKIAAAWSFERTFVGSIFSLIPPFIFSLRECLSSPIYFIFVMIYSIVHKSHCRFVVSVDLNCPNGLQGPRSQFCQNMLFLASLQHRIATNKAAIIRSWLPADYAPPEMYIVEDLHLCIVLPLKWQSLPYCSFQVGKYIVCRVLT